MQLNAQGTGSAGRPSRAQTCRQSGLAVPCERPLDAGAGAGVCCFSICLGLRALPAASLPEGPHAGAGELLPALALVGVGHMCAHCESVVQQQNALISPLQCTGSTLMSVLLSTGPSKAAVAAPSHTFCRSPCLGTLQPQSVFNSLKMFWRLDGTCWQPERQRQQRRPQHSNVLGACRGTDRHAEAEPHGLVDVVVGVLAEYHHAHLVQRAAVERPTRSRLHDCAGPRW